MKVTVKSTGNELWPSKGIDAQGTNRVGLRCRWFDSNGKMILEGRTLLPNDLKPASSVTLEVKVFGPSQPGDYTLRFSMV